MSKQIHLLLLIFLIATSLESKNINCGIKISPSVTNVQMEFLNNHYDMVVTSVLSQEIRDKIVNPELLLYRSIRDGWPNFTHFDWSHIDTCENMFCHSDSIDKTKNTRIFITRTNSWLMDGNDLVDPNDADAVNHWINYFAVTAADQVYTYNYDGLFIDSAGHRLFSNAYNGNMPWNYSDDSWRDGRYAALAFIKSYLIDKLVIFNGLHSDYGADSSLSLTDGGMWEGFIWNRDDDSYLGLNTWLTVMDLFRTKNEYTKLSLVVQKVNLIEDLQARIFSVASYLLVSNDNVGLTMTDRIYGDDVVYYPEFEIEIGDPMSNVFDIGNDFYARNFSNGLVLVNPNEIDTLTYQLQDDYYRIIPVGGGVIDSEENYDGMLTSVEVSGTLSLPPVSAVILSNTMLSVADQQIPDNIKLNLSNFPNPFNPNTTIKYTVPNNAFNLNASTSLKIYDITGIEIMTLVNDIQPSGSYFIKFNGDDLPNGVYFYQLRAGNSIRTNKMLLLK